MAAAIYSTDLQDIITDPASSTGWTLISSGGGGANSFTVPETDDYIQSANIGTLGCISRNPWSSAIRGMVFNSAQTVAAGNAIFIWTKSDVAQALASKASGGIQVLVGNSASDLKCYYVSGNDDAFGGWKCYPIDPTISPSTNLGSPTSTTSYFGVRWNVPSSGPSKGFPFKIDAIRRGRTAQVVDGDVTNGYATFLAMSSYAGDISRRWGLFFLRDGSYFQQGRFLIGTSATAADFRDSNRTIFIQNTEFVGSVFNTFEVQNSATKCYWTNINITALGTVSRGRFLATDNADIRHTDCVFTDMDTFNYLSSSIVTGCTFRRTGLITLGGGSITNCLITNSRATSALSVTTLANTTLNNFVSSGTGHAVELTSLGSGTMTWNNTLSGYAGSNGSTGNEAIFVNVASGNLTINVAAGATTPSIRTAGASVNVVSGQVTTTITVKSLATGAIIQGASVRLVADTGGPLSAGTVIFNDATDTNGQVTDTRSLASNQPVKGWVRKASSSPYYKQSDIVGIINNATGLTLTIQMILDE